MRAYAYLRLMVAAAVVAASSCGDGPVGPPSSPSVTIVSPAEGSRQNETVAANRCIRFSGRASRGGEPILEDESFEWYEGSTRLAGGISPCISFLETGAHSVELRVEDARARISFTIPNDSETVEVRLAMGRDSLFDREYITESSYELEVVRNTRRYSIRETGIRYGGTPTTFVDGRLDIPYPLAVGRRPLDVEWEAVGTDLRSTASHEVRVVPTPSLELDVRVVEAVSTSSANGFWTYAFRAGSAEPLDSVMVGADGIAILASLAFVEDTFEMHVVHPQAPAERALLRVARAELDFGEPLLVLLLPSIWNIAEGGHVGESVEVSIESAFLQHHDGTRLSSFYKREWTGSEWGYHTYIWPRELRPVCTVFDRASSGITVTPQDSTRFWQNLESMLLWYGIEFFAPCRDEEVPDTSGVQVRLDTVSSSTAGTTPKNSILTSGWVKFALNAHLVARSVSHEFSHVAGVGHTCMWNTIVYNGCNDVVQHTTVPSVDDVAYVQILYRFGDLKRELGLPYDPIVARLRGERFARGVSPDFPPP